MFRILALTCFAITISVGLLIAFLTFNDNNTQWMQSFIDSREGTCSVARTCIRDCYRKMGNVPFEKWPTNTQERFRVAQRVLEENGESE